MHYGVTLHEGAVLDADAFLMKGAGGAGAHPVAGQPGGRDARPARRPADSGAGAVPRPVLIATLVLAALIALAVSAGVALALSPRPVPPVSSPSTAVPHR